MRKYPVQGASKEKYLVIHVTRNENTYTLKTLGQ